jgi:hypothetical protein
MIPSHKRPEAPERPITFSGQVLPRLRVRTPHRRTQAPGSSRPARAGSRDQGRCSGHCHHQSEAFPAFRPRAVGRPGQGRLTTSCWTRWASTGGPSPRACSNSLPTRGPVLHRTWRTYSASSNVTAWLNPSPPCAPDSGLLVGTGHVEGGWRVGSKCAMRGLVAVVRSGGHNPLADARVRMLVDSESDALSPL